MKPKLQPDWPNTKGIEVREEGHLLGFYAGGTFLVNWKGRELIPVMVDKYRNLEAIYGGEVTRSAVD